MQKIDMDPAKVGTVVAEQQVVSNSLIAQVDRAEIKSQEDYGKGGDLAKVIRETLKDVDLARKAIVDKPTGFVKWINGQFKPLKDSLEKSKEDLGSKMLKFKKAEDARIQKENEERRRKQEEDALKAAEEAERIAKEEAEKKAAEELKRREEAGEKLSEEAVDAINEEALSEAQEKVAVEQDAILNAATSLAAEEETFTVTSEIGASTSVRKTWVGEGVSLKAICRAVADGHLPADIVSVSKSGLNQFAKQKEKEGVFYGIKCYEKETLTGR